MKEKVNPNPYHQDERLPTSALAVLDDLVYRFAVDRLAGYKYLYVILGRESTAARLGYHRSTISRAITRLKKLGYLKRAPQLCNPDGSWGPQAIVWTRKLAILINDKVKLLRLRVKKKTKAYRAAAQAAFVRADEEARRQADKLLNTVTQKYDTTLPLSGEKAGQKVGSSRGRGVGLPEGGLTALVKDLSSALKTA